MENTILSTYRLSKSYQVDTTHYPVIKQLDLEIRKGEFSVIMGQSGSGKSTLLHLLGGLDTCDSGEIILNGREIQDATEHELAIIRRKEIGFVFQDAHLVPNLTLEENVHLAGFLAGMRKREIVQSSNDLFKQARISDICSKYPSQVSGGERQRCAILRALVHQPSLLLADEPTGSLNSSNSESILDLFSCFHNRDLSIVMVTHDLASATRGDRILYFKDGVILEEFNDHLMVSSQQEKEGAIMEWLITKGW